MACAATTMTMKATTEKSRFRRYLPVLFGMTAFVFTLSIWQIATLEYNRNLYDEFETIAEELVQVADAELERYTDQLYAARGLYRASDFVNRREWNEFIDSLNTEERTPGVRVLEYVQRVAASELDEFVSSVREDGSLNGAGYPGFSVHPEQETDEYFVVTYLEPLAGNEAAFGFDLGSNPERREALELARDSDTHIASAPIKLVQADEQESAGFLIFLPVYEDYQAGMTIAQRRQELQGFVLGVYTASDILDLVIGGSNISQLRKVAVVVTDVGAAQRPEGLSELYESHADTEKLKMVISRQIDFGGRAWRFEMRPTFDFFDSVNVPNIILLSGILISLLVYWILNRFIALSGEEIRGLARFPSENPNPVLRVSSKDGVLIYANHSGAILLEDSDTRVGRRVPDFFWKNIQASVLSNQNRVLDVDHGDKIFSYVITPIVDAGYVNLYGREVTQERKVSQMKNEFVSLASHQLKTPVAEIRGYIDNMLSGITGKLNPKQEEYLLDMQDISSRNYRLISNLLNLSQIERGTVWMDIQAIGLEEIIGVVVKEYKGSILEKGLTFDFKKGDRDIVVLADKDKMIEALSNILNNAVKFTDKGSIVITVKSDGEYGYIEVSDSGKGMAEDLVARLFGKKPILSGTPVAGRGAGLGLYIANSLMELQHGGIVASSVVGKGSVFTIKIPLTKDGKL